MPACEDRVTTQEAAPRSYVVQRPGATIAIPREETLVYEVFISLGPFASNAGTVTQRTAVGPFQPSLLAGVGTEDTQGLETAYLSIHAKGGYQVYKLDTLIEARHFSRGWPRVVYRTADRGTEKRRREVKFGVRDGSGSASYRGDTEDGAPKGARIWTEYQTREVPADTLDMLSSIFMVRTLIEQKKQTLSFPLIDKLSLWQVTLRRREEKTVEIPAGAFEAVEVLIQPEPYAGEEISEKKKKRFKGLFGIHGETRLWVEKQTGVPVRIQGDLPIGFLRIGVDVRLRSYKGTPAAFRPQTKK